MLGIEELGEVDCLYHLLLDFCHGLLSVGEAHFLLAHLEGVFLAVLLHSQYTAVTIEGTETGTIAIGHLHEVHADISAAGWSFHSLGQGVGC